MTAGLTDGTVSHLLIRDRTLRAAVERMLANLRPDAAADPFRGLYISRQDPFRCWIRGWAARRGRRSRRSPTT